MTDPKQIAGLLDRVNAATGADRWIDGDMFEFIDPDFPKGGFRLAGGVCLPATFGTGAYTSVKAPPFTASIDAALALMERVLPGTAIGNCSYWPMLAGGESDDNRHANVTLIRIKDGWGIPSSSSRGSASTLPLAILSALLRALQAQSTESAQ